VKSRIFSREIPVGWSLLQGTFALRLCILATPCRPTSGDLFITPPNATVTRRRCRSFSWIDRCRKQCCVVTSR